MKTTAVNPEKVEMPPVAVFCVGIGIISTVVGPVLLFAAITDSQLAGSGSMAAVGGSLFFSSLIWFAIARVITLLAQIAHNTRREGK